MFLPSAWDTSTFPRLMSPCNIILLKWMKNLETYVPLSPPLDLTDMHDYLWGYQNHQGTYWKKSWYTLTPHFA